MSNRFRLQRLLIDAGGAVFFFFLALHSHPLSLLPAPSHACLSVTASLIAKGIIISDAEHVQRATLAPCTGSQCGSYQTSAVQPKMCPEGR